MNYNYFILFAVKKAVHRADTRKVKNFIRSYGNSAKTDSLDAKALARYGYERRDSLSVFTPQSKNIAELFSLNRRKMIIR